MKCPYCQHDLESGTAPYHIDCHGYRLSFDKVPAYVCQQCGQACFEEHRVVEIQETICCLDEHASRVMAIAQTAH
jgi:YgiT-type zinc finger domain-containing protein